MIGGVSNPTCHDRAPLPGAECAARFVDMIGCLLTCRPMWSRGGPLAAGNAADSENRWILGAGPVHPAVSGQEADDDLGKPRPARGDAGWRRHRRRRAKATRSAPMPGSTVSDIGRYGDDAEDGHVAPLGGHITLRAASASVPMVRSASSCRTAGWAHELVVQSLIVDATAGHGIPGGEGKVDETSSLGQVSYSCGAGDVDGVTADAIGWTQRDPGTGPVRAHLQPPEPPRKCDVRGAFAQAGARCMRHVHAEGGGRAAGCCGRPAIANPIASGSNPARHAVRTAEGSRS